MADERDGTGQSFGAMFGKDERTDAKRAELKTLQETLQPWLSG